MKGLILHHSRSHTSFTLAYASLTQGEWTEPRTLYTDAADVQYPWWQSKPITVLATTPITFKIGTSMTTRCRKRRTSHGKRWREAALSPAAGALLLYCLTPFLSSSTEPTRREVLRKGDGSLVWEERANRTLVPERGRHVVLLTPEM